MAASRFDFRKSILFEDDDFVIVNKPPSISTLADRNSPLNMLEMARSIYSQVQVCHRLDKETSGVLVFAKHAQAYRLLAMQFENRQVAKAYHALAEGRPQFDQREVSASLLRRGDGDVKPDPRGKPAISRFSTMETFKAHALVLCEPLTGRTHQIRVHLRMLGTPIAGDVRYGGKPLFLSQLKAGYTGKGKEERPLMPRIALHAISIEFVGPGGVPIRVEAPYPKDFSATLRQLRLL